MFKSPVLVPVGLELLNRALKQTEPFSDGLWICPAQALGRSSPKYMALVPEVTAKHT